MGLGVYGNLTFPFVSIVPDYNGSVWNIYPAPTPGFPTAQDRFLFGVVDGINYLGTKCVVGQRVMFDSDKAVLVTQADVRYYVTDENYVMFQENPLV